MIQINWLADYVAWRKWRQAAYFMLAAQVLDLLTMLAVVYLVGIEAEINPFLRLAWTLAGPGGLVAVKLGFTLVLYCLAQIGPGRPFLILAGIIGLLGAALNSYVLWLVMVAR